MKRESPIVAGGQGRSASSVLESADLALAALVAAVVLALALRCAS